FKTYANLPEAPQGEASLSNRFKTYANLTEAPQEEASLSNRFKTYANLPEAPQEEASLSNRYVGGTPSLLPQVEYMARSPNWKGGQHTTGPRRNSRKTMRLPPRGELRPDSPALTPEPPPFPIQHDQNPKNPVPRGKGPWVPCSHREASLLPCQASKRFLRCPSLLDKSPD
ncbi:unnamed protein product, partial [Rangifer tarandus platyrhynchus]